MTRNELTSGLTDIVGSTGILLGEDVQLRDPGYFMDRIEANVLVRPQTTEQVSEVMKLCHRLGQPVVVQGGMSGWVRGTQTSANEVVVSMERMRAIEEIDSVNRTATVQAGVILQDLQETLEAHDLVFPLDLGGRGSCQLGGNASTNAGGLRVIRYGMMRQLVLGVEAVLADGTVINSLNKMIKSNAGYDVKQLFLGTEGTLGVITRLVLRLYERSLSSNSGLVALKDFKSVASFLRHMDKSLGGALSAYEVMDSSFYAINTAPGRHKPPMENRYPYYVLLESLGFKQSADTDMFEAALQNGLEDGLIEDAILPKSESERNTIWAIREDLEHVVKDVTPFKAFDVSLPIGEMEAYMHAVRDGILGRWRNAKLCFLGHVGDGNLHIAVGNGSDNERDSKEVEQYVYEPLRDIRGCVSAEHGIGLEKKDFLSVSRTPGEIDLMRLLKTTLDPKNILNPGKVLDIDEFASHGNIG